MKICGIKASHDGGVAVIEDGSLRFSVEIEKLDNGARYSYLGDLQRVIDILANEGVSSAEIDQFVVDGWYTLGANGSPAITLRNEGRPVELAVAPYVESPGDEGPLQRHRFDGHAFIGGVGYVSFSHVTNHLLGAYCSSLCVPKTSSTSCDQAVFVDRATDMSPSPDAVLVEVDRFG